MAFTQTITPSSGARALAMFMLDSGTTVHLTEVLKSGTLFTKLEAFQDIDSQASLRTGLWRVDLRV